MNRLPLAPLSLLLLASLSTGCGVPMLRHRALSTNIVMADPGCSEDGVVLRYSAVGGTFGESLEIEVFAPHDLSGTISVRTGDEEAESRRFAVRMPEPEEGGSERDAVTSGTAPPPPAVRSGAAPPPPVVASGAAPPPPVVASGAAPPQGVAASVSAPSPSGRGHFRGGVTVDASGRVRVGFDYHGTPGAPYTIEPIEPRGGLTVEGGQTVRWHFYARGQPTTNIGRLAAFGYHSTMRSWTWRDPTSGSSPLSEGTPVVVRIRPDGEQCLDDAVLVVRRHALVPPPGYGDVTMLAELRRRAAQEAAAAEAEEARRARRCQRRRAWERERHARWVAYCRAHRESERCWGPGGYEGRVRLAAARAALEEERRHPPPPRPETRPPRPSPSARWIAGRWRWTNTGWAWVLGRWQIPEAEIVVRQEPPPPRQEHRPPQPAEGLIWVPGYWQWNGQTYVWIEGSWQVPPSPELRWAPPTVRRRGGSIVIVPGRWTVRIGR